MQLTSTGILRKRKTKQGTAVRHFSDADPIRVFTNENAGRTRLKVRVYGSRAYTLMLNPDEILRCLLTLPPTAIGDALATAEDIKACDVPELLKELARGAMQRQSQVSSMEGDAGL